MIAAFDQWLKVPKDQLTVITKIIEMLHNASLLYECLHYRCSQLLIRPSTFLALTMSRTIHNFEEESQVRSFLHLYD
jgi:hypothetical protein